MAYQGISVVIPNYNGRHLLEQILPCLYKALGNSGQEYEVIISDDRSTDDSISYLEEYHPSVILIQNPVNRGFSPTINEGIFKATKGLVLLLNSDVKLTPDYFHSLFKYFDLPDTFGVMGRIIGWEDEKIQDAAKYPSFHGAKIKTSGNYYAAQPSENDRLYSMYLSGANALVDRKKLVSLGGFDEIYAPFYVEDFDISLRAWRLGWKCYYDHFAVCRHQVSVSIKSSSSKRFINTIYYRNKMFLHAMHLSGGNKILWCLQQIPETLIRIFTLRFYYLRSLSLFFQGRKKMQASTKKLNDLAKHNGTVLLDVEKVVTVITGSVKDKSIERF